ncbi:AAA family ATPase [Pseudomonas rhodesiae]|uniref:ATP-dependent nuclease n=1 Tax=Pseudomonas rhodesiae TaxID=76760 RepID=UPI0028D18FFB|nr:AAA family ATPase [Pseudomonas rhodesiae]
MATQTIPANLDNIIQGRKMAVKTIKELTDSVRKLKPGAPLLNYITHARFPNFKGLERNAELDFPFALTALVGANGIGKSSVLHALYGMPEGQSTAKYWFATAVDPIEVKVVRDPPRYVYGHWHEGVNGPVETRKARIHNKARAYEYWEPTKVSKNDGMTEIPAEEFDRKSTDRWNPVIREVVYINSKFNIGAFDRNFNFGDKDDSQTEKYAEMQWGANKLRRAIDQDLQSWHLGGGRERIFENRMLKQVELDAISLILGRSYSSARLIKHSLYPTQRGKDTSVIFERGRQYSEAFAGSGEISVVSIVTQVLSAPRYSLILLDEPETSLHPGAQKELLAFLLEQILKKHLQVVISTHAIDFIEDLPENAIKVFEDNGQGKTHIINSSSPYIALNRLGRTLEKKKTILVEDAMAKIVLERAAQDLHEGEQNALDIRICPGGAEAILSRQVPAMLQAGSKVFAYLDGDKKKVDVFSESKNITQAMQTDLPEIIKSEVGCSPSFTKNGGNDKQGIQERNIQNHLQYLDWMSSYLEYIPLCCPDAIVYECLTDKKRKFTVSAKAKDELRAQIGLDQTAENSIGVARYALNKCNDNPHITQITKILKKWVATE